MNTAHSVFHYKGISWKEDKQLLESLFCLLQNSLEGRILFAKEQLENSWAEEE